MKQNHAEYSLICKMDLDGAAVAAAEKSILADERIGFLRLP